MQDLSTASVKLSTEELRATSAYRAAVYFKNRKSPCYFYSYDSTISLTTSLIENRTETDPKIGMDKLVNMLWKYVGNWKTAIIYDNKTRRPVRKFIDGNEVPVI
jgi:hypothetical protein